MLAVTICATKSYTYAMQAQAHLVAANIAAAGVKLGHVILVGDTSPELKNIEKFYKDILPDGWTVKIYDDSKRTEGGQNYKERAQMLIADMRQEAFTVARKVQATECWSLDSDVLPPANALRCMLTMLKFDNGYYSVSTCPYPNTSFLGGFGSPRNHIAEDYIEKERKVTPELKAQLEADEAELKALNEAKTPVTDEHKKKWAETHKKIKECPPDGNIWEVIAKHGWRRRGWLDNAYPAIGKGSVVPVDWCGFGCTLLNRDALAVANFNGYEGKGTEDLFIVWSRWFPAGLRINCIPHCPCDHIIWDKKKEGGDEKKFTHHMAYHETDPEYFGHRRRKEMPWSRELPAK